MDPGDLSDNIEAALSHPERLTEEQLKQLKTLQNSISVNDNNYLFVGKIKQSGSPLELEKAQPTPVIQAKVPATEEEIDTVVFNTATVENWKEYFRTNNKFKDWNPEQKTRTLVGAIIEKDGTPGSIRIIKGSGNKELDQEAIRLVKNATIKPAINKDKIPVKQTNWVIFIEFPPK